MFDIGMSEMLIIGIVALIVVGPKDLPVMFRQLGRITAKARSMAREFSRAMEDAAKESGVADVAKDLKTVTSKKSLGLDALERAADRFEKWDPKSALDQTQAKSAEAKILGPETQALADKQAAARADRAAGAASPAMASPASVLPDSPVAAADTAVASPAGDSPAAPTPDAAPAAATATTGADIGSELRRMAVTRSRDTTGATGADGDKV